MANKITITKKQVDFNKHLSMHTKVQQGMSVVAGKMHRNASASLAAHRKTGSHTIKFENQTNTKYGHIDHYVVMEGPAAVSVEYGHWSASHKRYVQGLYIMTNALISARL